MDAQKTYWDEYYQGLAEHAAGRPFPESSFDAVMANVALRMFTDAVTDDRAVREPARPVRRELEPDYVLEDAGQTLRCFSRKYLNDLLADWQVPMLDHVEITHARRDVPVKGVWRVAART